MAPSAIETSIALTMRRFATPSAVRDVANPVPATPEALVEALAHFADHCATCNANDGSGNTERGRSFCPPAPDTRAARTQQLSDGELFSIIEHGIRLTGMPAWGTGTPEGERGSWGWSTSSEAAVADARRHRSDGDDESQEPTGSS